MLSVTRRGKWLYDAVFWASWDKVTFGSWEKEVNSIKSHTSTTEGEEPAFIAVERSVLASGLLTTSSGMVWFVFWFFPLYYLIFCFPLHWRNSVSIIFMNDVSKVPFSITLCEKAQALTASQKPRIVMAGRDLWRSSGPFPALSAFHHRRDALVP